MKKTNFDVAMVTFKLCVFKIALGDLKDMMAKCSTFLEMFSSVREKNYVKTLIVKNTKLKSSLLIVN